MARSDNPEWNITKKENFRIPAQIKEPAALKARLLADAGYEIDDTFIAGPIDLTKYVRAMLVVLANESVEQSIKRLGLTRKVEQ
jgi:hypothetical protein